jgi:hypothetical protein
MKGRMGGGELRAACASEVPSCPYLLRSMHSRGLPNRTYCEGGFAKLEVLFSLLLRSLHTRQQLNPMPMASARHLGDQLQSSATSAIAGLLTSPGRRRGSGCSPGALYT